MARGRLLLLASMSALAVAAPAMAGKKVPSAEQGAVPLLMDAPLALDAPVTVRPGEIAWREIFRPERNVRLLDAAVERKRPAAQGVPAGSLLFGYRLGSGVAYCPAADITRGVITVQCFRDFNRDGKFEGGYVTEYHDTGSRYLAGSVRALGAAGNMRYERIEAATAAPIDGAFKFIGFKDDVAQFRLMVDNTQTDAAHPCAPIAGDVCEMVGLRLRIERQGESARITLLEAAPGRQLQINMYGLSLPGPRS